MKKSLGAILIASSLLVSSSSVFAEPVGDNNIRDAEISADAQKLVDYGFDASVSDKIAKVDYILKEMLKTGQQVDLVNNEIQIINPPNLTNAISKDDEQTVINYFKESLSNQSAKVKKVSQEERMNDIKQSIENNPNRSKYRIDYPDGSWIQASSTLEKVDTITSDEVKTEGNLSYPHEVEVGSGTSYPGDGEYIHKYTITENYGQSGYALNWIQVDYTVSNGQHHVHINNAHNGQDSGIGVGVQNSGKYINIVDTDYSQDPTTWCEAESQVVFGVTGSVGLSLFGVLSFSVNVGYNWTQYAITRESLVAQHDYAAYQK